MKFLLTVRSVVLSAALLPAGFGASPSRPEDKTLVSLAAGATESRRISLPTVQFMLGGSRKKAAPDRSLSPEAVENMLGPPGAKVSSHVWVYWNFKTDDIPACASGDTLIVEFMNDRVESVRFGRSTEVRAFIARRQIAALKTKIAAE